MNTTEIDDLIARLKTAQGERLNPLDYPRTWTQRQVHAYANETNRYAATVSALRNAPPHVERFQQRLDAVEERRAAHLAKKAELEQTLANEPDWREPADGRARDRQYDKLQALRLQLQLLAEGNLFSSPGVCFEPLEHLDRQIRELSARRDGARAQLDSALREAEILLAAEPVSG